MQKQNVKTENVKTAPALVGYAERHRRNDLMAKNPAPTPAPVTATRGRGRPPKDAADARSPTEVALGNLQYAMDRACAFVNDGGNSVAARAARCARAGVPRATVDKALAAMEAALEDAREGVERAYAAPQAKAAPARRVDLLA